MKLARDLLGAVAAVIWFAIWIVLPDRLGAGLAIFFCGVGGAGLILYPQVAIKWSTRAHPALDVNDQALWWIPRTVGSFFFIFAIAMSISLLRT